jgi:dihydroorotase/N-acyl-D-amino-acid deacylase
MARVAILLLLLLSVLASQQAPLDVLVTGGRVIDGTGSPFFYADIGIRGDAIVFVGAPGTAVPAARRIDAKGLVVAPGFIDIHSHSRGAIFEVPSGENVLRQGVTTIVEGNDGSSPLPLKPFFDKLEGTKLGINWAMFAGHGSIRGEVMGSQNREPRPEELDRMRALMEQAMQDGAFGLSTGLFYVPGNFGKTEEVIELAKVAARYGGMHISHMRDETTGTLDSVRETIRIGEEGGLPTQVTHHKIAGKRNWGLSKESLRLIEEARARGVDVTVDQYPYTASSTSLGAALFPQWSMEGGQKAFAERMSAPGQRARIKTVVMEKIEFDRGGGDARNIVLASCSFDPSLAGKSLYDVAAAKGLPVTFDTAAEAAIELQLKGGCSAIFHAIGEEDVRRIMTYPHTMIASDGGVSSGRGVPHPRNYGTFPRVLGHYVREQKLLSLEEAIRKMSGLPAQRLKLWDRGLIRPGMKADIAIFDPDIVADKAEFGKPHQMAVGFSYVLVNGKLVIDGGRLTAERPGRVLYGPGRARN